MDEIIFGDTILTTKPIRREQRVIDVAIPSDRSLHNLFFHSCTLKANLS